MCPFNKGAEGSVIQAHTEKATQGQNGERFQDAGLEDGVEQPITEECQQPETAGRDKEQTGPQSLWREHGLAKIWILAQDTVFFFTSGLKNQKE